MRHILLYIFPVLFLLPSCEHDKIMEEDGNNSFSSDGVFVVDYAASSMETKAISENLSAGERINSLTYLLYSSDGSLLKEREIPGLEGKEETWPLKRDNMTWEQREALKDTLMQGMDYYVVFVANAAPSLWGVGTTESPLKDKDSYSTVYLQLPNIPFSDNKMFYIYSGELKYSSTYGADRDNPYSYPVVLQRVVARSDFFFEVLPEWGDGESPEPERSVTYPVTCTLPDGVKNYLNSSVSSIFSGNYSSLVEEMETQTNEFLDMLITYFTTNQKDTYVTAVNTLKTTINSNLQPAEYVADAAVNTLKTTINSNEGNENFIRTILTEDLINHLQNTLLNSCSNNETLKTIWKNSDLSGGQTAKVSYKQNVARDKYFIGSKSVSEATTVASPSTTIDIPSVVDGVGYNGFNLIAFANSGNWIDKITVSEDIVIPFNLETTAQGDNEKRVYYYHPVYSLETKGTGTISTNVYCDMERALPFDVLTEGDNPLITDLDAFKTAINGAMASGDEVGLNNSYGENLENVQISLTLPDLSKSEVLDIISKWEEK